MPNWCNGSIEVKGNPKDIEKFCKLFIFEDDKENKEQYFARSFTQDTWKSFKKSYIGENAVNFCIDFAWSAHSCLIDGYPQENEECITLMDACKKYKVNVTIDSEEGGFGFEEHIECDPKGKLIEECYDMPEYKCKCGHEQIIASSYDLDEVDCYECEEIGQWEKIK
jgi:hypothetical protein